VVETLVGRVKTGLEAIALPSAAVVRRVAILEAVGKQEIDDLVLRKTCAIIRLS
jgi:hypothetical protein